MTISEFRWSSCGLSKCLNGHQGSNLKKLASVIRECLSRVLELLDLLQCTAATCLQREWLWLMGFCWRDIILESFWCYFLFPLDRTQLRCTLNQKAHLCLNQWLVM